MMPFPSWKHAHARQPRPQREDELLNYEENEFNKASDLLSLIFLQPYAAKRQATAHSAPYAIYAHVPLGSHLQQRRHRLTILLSKPFASPATHTNAISAGSSTRPSARASITCRQSRAMMLMPCSGLPTTRCSSTTARTRSTCATVQRRRQHCAAGRVAAQA
jgi:hypothetical protein